MEGLISAVITYLVSLVDSLGYFGIFVGMLVESSFFPFPSELILPPAGVLISQGKMLFSLVLLSSILGSLAGAWINYVIALQLGRRLIKKLTNKYGKFLLISNKSLDKSDHYFKKHGSITTFTGRLIPGIRQLISLPAGFSKMDPLKFSIYTSLGAGIWSTILIYLGILYGSNQTALPNAIASFKIIGLILIITTLLTYFILKKKSSRRFSSIN